MIRSMHAHGTAGLTAAATRVRVQLGLGYGWQMAALPCDITDFAVQSTNKRQPRRLGKRST